MAKGRRDRQPWFAIRSDLSRSRQTVLTAISFLLPLAIWCVVSYVPFIWHPDIKLQVGAGGATVYTAGDYVGKDFFPTVVEQVREENRKVMSERAAGEVPAGSTRENKKILRRIAGVAVQNKALGDDEREDDAKIFEIWKGLATGTLEFKRPRLTEENMAIVKADWETLSGYSSVYDPENFPSEPLLKLLPQGRPANPVYLPAPGEVLQAGIREWTREPADGKSSMGEKLFQSLQTVFGGFLLAAIFAIPLGILAGTYDFFGKLVEPFVDFFRYMPAPAFSTLLVAVLGAHDAPKLALVFLGTFPHLLLMITKTSRLLDPALLEASQTLGANQRNMLFRVVVPGIWPNVYNDLRIALGWAWTWLVIAELIGVKTGLTEVIDTQGDRRNFDQVFPVIILIGIIGFFTDQTLSWLRRFLFPWSAEAEGRQGWAERGVRGFGRWIEPAMEAHRKKPRPKLDHENLRAS
ncbi:MAG: ABC transporter permease [Verrucomicrobiota bacterium]